MSNFGRVKDIVRKEGEVCMKQKLMKCMISLFMCSVFVVTMLLAK